MAQAWQRPLLRLHESTLDVTSFSKAGCGGALSVERQQVETPRVQTPLTRMQEAPYKLPLGFFGGFKSQVRLAYDLPLEVMRQPVRSLSAGALRSAARTSARARSQRAGRGPLGRRLRWGPRVAGNMGKWVHSISIIYDIHYTYILLLLLLLLL